MSSKKEELKKELKKEERKVKKEVRKERVDHAKVEEARAADAYPRRGGTGKPAKQNHEAGRRVKAHTSMENAHASLRNQLAEDLEEQEMASRCYNMTKLDPYFPEPVFFADDRVIQRTVQYSRVTNLSTLTFDDGVIGNNNTVNVGSTDYMLFMYCPAFSKLRGFIGGNSQYVMSTTSKASGFIQAAFNQEQAGLGFIHAQKFLDPRFAPTYEQFYGSDPLTGVAKDGFVWSGGVKIALNRALATSAGFATYGVMRAGQLFGADISSNSGVNLNQLMNTAIEVVPLANHSSIYLHSALVNNQVALAETGANWTDDATWESLGGMNDNLFEQETVSWVLISQANQSLVGNPSPVDFTLAFEVQANSLVLAGVNDVLSRALLSSTKVQPLARLKPPVYDANVSQRVMQIENSAPDDGDKQHSWLDTAKKLLKRGAKFVDSPLEAVMETVDDMMSDGSLDEVSQEPPSEELLEARSRFYQREPLNRTIEAIRHLKKVWCVIDRAPFPEALTVEYKRLKQALVRGTPVGPYCFRFPPDVKGGLVKPPAVEEPHDLPKLARQQRTYLVPSDLDSLATLTSKSVRSIKP